MGYCGLASLQKWDFVSALGSILTVVACTALGKNLNVGRPLPITLIKEYPPPRALDC